MGWELFGWSFSVLRKNKTLLAFPLFSGIAAVAGLFLCYMAKPASVWPEHLKWQDISSLIPAYFLVSFLVIFFNTALAACAQAQFSGQEATVGYGLSKAADRFLPILGWALISTTVGLILKMIERRASWAGKIAVWIFGAAWGMATYLVLPVLAAEDVGPMEAVRRSAKLLKETWGDQLVAGIRFGWRGLVFFMPCLLLGVLGMNGYPVFLPIAVAAFILASVVLSAARGVFEVALYRYAANGELPAGFTPDLMPGIFSRGNGRAVDI